MTKPDLTLVPHKPDPDRIRILARADLQRTDWKLMRAMERHFAGAEWCDWRDVMRGIASKPEGHAEPLPPEPPFGQIARNEPTTIPDPEKEALVSENARLRAEIESLRAVPPPEVMPGEDERLSDWGPVGDDIDITGDDLLKVFEQDEASAAAAVRTMSALRQKHLSEQLNVEKARLRREHAATGVPNPRAASIDRLLGLLTRRGEV
jgi:hypothetical protein